MPGEFPRLGWPVPQPFAGEIVRLVSAAGEAFAVAGAEVEDHREAAFAEAGVLFQAESLLPHLSESAG